MKKTHMNLLPLLKHGMALPMITSSIVKRIASVVLCLAFFLPLSQCTPKESVAQARPAPVSVQIAAYSIYEWPSLMGALAAALFFWPIAAQGLARRYRRRSWFIAEILLCALTGTCISSLALWGDAIRFGAFLAFGAIIFYAGAAIYDIASLRHATSEEPEPIR